MYIYAYVYIYKYIYKGTSVSSPDRLRDTTIKQFFALSLGLPACFITILLLKKYGTKLVQTFGFIFIAISFFLIACIYDVCRNKYPNVLYGVYCLLLFSLSGGPMLTTFILPSETFPKEIRATFGGIAAASGKLGIYIFLYICL
jgi:PHS family inorganic phosphate transporter-like MFS transporter